VLRRDAAGKVRPGGTLVFMSGTGARRPGIGLAIAAMATAVLPALAANPVCHLGAIPDAPEAKEPRLFEGLVNMINFE
jgi:hypothetical protein